MPGVAAHQPGAVLRLGSEHRLQVAKLGQEKLSDGQEPRAKDRAPEQASSQGNRIRSRTGKLEETPDVVIPQRLREEKLWKKCKSQG